MKNSAKPEPDRLTFYAKLLNFRTVLKMLNFNLISTVFSLFFEIAQ
jgi:hypothetical protein